MKKKRPADVGGRRRSVAILKMPPWRLTALDGVRMGGWVGLACRGDQDQGWMGPEKEDYLIDRNTLGGSTM